MTIKTNYISATAGSSSFPPCAAFTYKRAHPPVFLPASHQPIIALCSFFFSFFWGGGSYSPMRSQIHFHLWMWTKVRPHWLHTCPACVCSHNNWAPLTCRVLTGPKWRHSVSLILFGWGLLYFLTSVLLLVSIHLKWAIQSISPTMLLVERLLLCWFQVHVTIVEFHRQERILPR